MTTDPLYAALVEAERDAWGATGRGPLSFASVVIPRQIKGRLAVARDLSGVFILSLDWANGAPVPRVLGYPVEWSTDGTMAFVTREGDRVPFTLPGFEV